MSNETVALCFPAGVPGNGRRRCGHFDGQLLQQRHVGSTQGAQRLRPVLEPQPAQDGPVALERRTSRSTGAGRWPLLTMLLSLLQSAAAQAALQAAQALAGQTETQGGPNTVLRVIVEHMVYPVTLDVLFQVRARLLLLLLPL